jgi:pimeloyl-ACP methyl ester carboxylesterase
VKPVGWLHLISIEMPHADASSTLARPFRRIAAGIVMIVVAIAGCGAIYQRVCESRDRRVYPMPGRLVDVGGYKMHIDCMGDGAPAVILDSGLGDNYTSWRKVQPRVAQFTQVCSYDRAGLGYSDSSPGRRNSQVFAEELHTLLRNAGIEPPNVLVGHSMGGFDVRIYTSLYHGEVAGMVLVDSSHPEQQKRLPPAVNDIAAGWVREQEFFEFTMPFGLPRWLGFCSSDAEVRAADCNFRNLRESVAELKSISESAAQTAATGTLGDLPLAVLSQDPDAPQYDLPEDLVEPTNHAWQQMQNELAQLSSRSAHGTAKYSGHYIQLDRPELVIDAIQSLIEQVRMDQASRIKR